MIFKPTDIFVKHYFTDKSELDKINSRRSKYKKKPITFSNLVGYDYREIANLQHNIFFHNQQQENLVNELVDKFGYVTREGAVAHHQDYFKENDVDLVLGLCNGNLVKLKTFGNDVKEWNKLAKEHQNKPDTSIERLIISLDPEHTEFIKKHKISHEQLLFNFENIFLDYAKALGFCKNNLCYNLSFHTNTDNLHCHIDFFQKEIVKKRGKLKIQAPKENMKERIAKSFNDKLNLRTYKDLVIDRNYLEKLLNPVSQMDEKLYRDLYFAKNKKFGYIKDKDLKERFTKFVDNYIIESSLQEHVEATYYDKFLYYKYFYDSEDKAREVVEKLYENGYDKFKQSVANTMIDMIKENDMPRGSNFNDEDKFKELSNNFNHQLSYQRMLYILSGYGGANGIIRNMQNQFKIEIKQQMREY